MKLLDKYISRRVDKRFEQKMKEMMCSTSLSVREVSDDRAKKDIEDFIHLQQKKGNKELSFLDFVASLNLPANQVQNILDSFENEHRIKEINYA